MGGAFAWAGRVCDSRNITGRGRVGSVCEREREAPNCFPGEVSDTTPTFAHAMTNTAAFDATKEYCTRDIVFFWQPPSCLSQWTPSRFTVEVFSCSRSEQLFAAEKTRLFMDHQTLQHITRLSDPHLPKQYGREVRNFDLAVWGRERENIALVGSYASSPKIQSCNHISWTRPTGFSRKLALTTSYGASDTGQTTYLHASRPCSAA